MLCTSADDAAVDGAHGEARVGLGQLQVDVIEGAEGADVLPEALMVVRIYPEALFQRVRNDILQKIESRAQGSQRGAQLHACGTAYTSLDASFQGT